MELRDLRFFATLARELHFGRAAAELHIAQPALSQQLKRLERELGVTLVERSSRHVRLTAAGERFRDEARDVLSRVDGLVAAMRLLRDGLGGELVLGISPGVRPELLSALVSRMTAGTSVGVRTSGASSTDTPERLRRREIDAALLHSAPALPDVADLELCRDVLGVALPVSHPLARRRAIAPRDLRGERLFWVGPDEEPELHDLVMGRLASEGFEAADIQRPPTVDTSLNLVAAGVGVSFKLRHELTGPARRGVVWRPFAGAPIHVPTTLVWRRDDTGALVARLVAEARSIASAPPEPPGRRRSSRVT